MALQDQIIAQVTAPGAPFELIEEEVLGERMPVFKTRPRSLRDLLMESAGHSEKEYVVKDDRRISFIEHIRLVSSVAQALSERYQIGPGDVVAIAAANCPEWIISFWAITSLGGTVAAFNGLWTADEIRYGIEKVEPKLLIGDRRRLDRVDGRTVDLPEIQIESDFAELERYAPAASLPDTPIDEDAPAVILFTSGTTGRPKGAVVSHRALIGFVKTQSLHGMVRAMSAAEAMASEGAATPPAVEPCALVTVPLFHLSGLYACAILMLAQGIKTVYRAPRFNAEDVMRLIEEEKVTMWSALGSAPHQLLDDPALDRYDLSSLRSVGFGGAPTSPDLQERIAEALPTVRGNLGMGYGLSESGGMGAIIGGSELTQRPTSTGRAAVGHEIEIRDERGEKLPPGQYGEIHIRSPYLMLEYWRDPAATARTLLPGRWLATGDIGRLDEEAYLYIDSRARDMILRSGENIYPVEIENRLDAHPKVRESAVIGVEHATLGQEVKAVVVPMAGTTLEETELSEFVARSLAAYKVPSLWEVRTEALPRNAAGKVIKKVLTGEATLEQVEE